jgi:hypothetical protein
MSRTILCGDVNVNRWLPFDQPALPRADVPESFALSLPAFAASAERIKRNPPTGIEAARIASDQAMSDGMLRTGDVVATDRGFFQFRGLAPNGNADFVPVPNPLAPKDAFGSRR